MTVHLLGINSKGVLEGMEVHTTLRGFEKSLDKLAKKHLSEEVYTDYQIEKWKYDTTEKVEEINRLLGSVGVEIIAFFAQEVQ